MGRLWMRRCGFLFDTPACITQLAITGSGTDSVGLLSIELLKSPKRVLRLLNVTMPLISLC